MDMKVSLKWMAIVAGCVALVACQNNEETKEKGGSATEEQRNDDSETDQRSKAGQRLSPPDTVTITLDDWTLAVSYGSPSVRDREIWGELVPYDKVWRTGANEATVFQTNQPVTILGKDLPPGEYALFTIPGQKTWTIIFNKVWNQWGAYEYNENEDALRVTVKPENLNTFSEQLAFDLKKEDEDSVVLIFLWEQLQFTLPIEKSQ